MPATIKRPFWLHQLAEYIIGLAAIATGLQSPSPLASALMGGIVVVNAAVADGPFGAFRWISRRHHRWADRMVLVAMVVFTALPGVEVSTRLVQGALVVVFAVVIFGTNYTEPAKKRPDLAGDSSKAVELGRQAGRLSGTMAARIRQRTEHKNDQ